MRTGLCDGPNEDEKCDGCFRELEAFLKLLASFYFSVEEKENIPLLWFNELNTFQVVLGGDGNCSEDSPVVQPFVKRLLADIVLIESKVYFLMGREVKFRFAEFPNYLKMLVLLAGKLPVSPKFFLTFGNVSTDECDDPTGTFGLHSCNKWNLGITVPC